MTYLQGECSYRSAEAEEEMQRRSSDHSQEPPFTYLKRQLARPLLPHNRQPVARVQRLQRLDVAAHVEFESNSRKQ